METVSVNIQLPGESVETQIKPNKTSREIINTILGMYRNESNAEEYRLVEIYFVDGRICNEHVLSPEEHPFDLCRSWPMVADFSTKRVNGFTFYLVTGEDSELVSYLHSRFQQQKYLTHVHSSLILTNPFTQLELGQMSCSGKCVVVSGESGAGKSCCVKSVLGGISQRISTSFWLVQTFINAKTSGNPDSSRAGLFVRVFFGEDKTVEGLSFDHFLLDNRRVVDSKALCNFHIFYYLLDCQDMSIRDEFKLLSVSECACLRSSLAPPDVSYSTLVRTLNWLGVEAGLRSELFRVLSAILHLGNVPFDGASLKVVAQLLMVPLDCLVYHSSTTLAIVLYNCVLNMLIQHISLHKTTPRWLGVLEVGPFHNTDSNNFYHFCNNYVNEWVHHLHEYTAHQTEWAVRPVIDLFDLPPSGLFYLMENNSAHASLSHIFCAKHKHSPIFSLISQTDFSIRHYAGLVTYSLQDFASTNAIVPTPRLLGLLRQTKLPNLRRHLVISPPACRRWRVVKYCMLFVLAVKPTAPLTVKDKVMFMEQLGRGESRLSHQGGEGIVLQLKKRVMGIMHVMRHSKVELIRCIKANDEGREEYFDSAVVLRQIKQIQAVRSQYIHSMDLNEFRDHFCVCLGGVEGGIREFMEREGLFGGYRVSEDKICYSEGIGKELASRVRLFPHCVTLQKCIRGCLRRREFETEGSADVTFKPPLTGTSKVEYVLKSGKYNGCIIPLAGDEEYWGTALGGHSSRHLHDRVLLRKVALNMVEQVVLRDSADLGKLSSFITQKVESYYSVSLHDQMFVSCLEYFKDYPVHVFPVTIQHMTDDFLAVLHKRVPTQDEDTSTLLSNAFCGLLDQFRCSQSKKKSLVFGGVVCEDCSSSIRLLDKTVVCRQCKLTVHKKCVGGHVCAHKLLPLDYDMFSAIILGLEDAGGLDEVGIYRKSGSATQSSLLKQLIKEDWRAIQFRDYPVTTLATVIKALFREMCHPLFCVYDELMRVSTHLQSLIAVLSKTPIHNLRIYSLFMWHCARVIANSPVNLMDCHNLSTVLSPCFIKRNCKDPATLLLNVTTEIACMETVLGEYSRRYDHNSHLFAPLIERRKALTSSAIPESELALQLKVVSDERVRLEKSLDLFDI